jgi:thiamine-monophosphate kinase
VRIDLDAGTFAKDREALRSAARAVAAATGLGDPGWGPGNADIDGLVGRWIWAGGEDHGLLATFPAGAPLPTGWTAVGQVEELAAAGLGPAPARAGAAELAGELESRVTIGGKTPDTASGWDHFHP